MCKINYIWNISEFWIYMWISSPRHSNIYGKICLNMTKCPRLSFLSISHKRLSTYCSMSSPLNSGMFPFNCPYRNKYIFGEIEEVNHMKHFFPMQANTFLSLFSYPTSSNVLTLTYFFQGLLGHLAISCLRLNHTPARTCYYTLEAMLLSVQRPFIPSYKTGYYSLTVILPPPKYSSSLIISQTHYFPPASKCSPSSFFIRQAGELSPAVIIPWN